MPEYSVRVPKKFLKWHPTAVTYFKAHMGEYSSVVLSTRLLAMIQFLGQMTTQEQVETGGFLIKTGVGMSGQMGVRMVNLVKGEGKAIVLEPQEKLEHGEEYLGTFHSHPMTEVPSIHDVLSFLADPTEQISIVHGVQGTINLMLKKPTTRLINPAELEQMKMQYDIKVQAQGIPKQDPAKMTILVRDFGFMYFTGNGAVLQRTFEVEQIPENPISLDEIAYGIQGSPQFPAATKKKPLKKEPPGGLSEGTTLNEEFLLPPKSYHWSKLGPEYDFDPVLNRWVKKRESIEGAATRILQEGMCPHGIPEEYPCSICSQTQW